MRWRFLSLGARALALLTLLGAPGRIHAQGIRGVPHGGMMMPGFRGPMMPGFRGPMIPGFRGGFDPRFDPRVNPRFNRGVFDPRFTTGFEPIVVRPF